MSKSNSHIPSMGKGDASFQSKRLCPLVNQLHATQGVETLLDKEKTEQDLAKEFNGYVNDTRCLIVLNNLSIIEEWDQIKKCFTNNKKGS
jgi:hypothetical protein